jgi:hypothetical protein
MKATPVLSVILAVLTGGCVTGTTIEAAKEHVNYKPQKVEENGKITPLEVESVDKAKPGYYALVPFAVAADVVLMPVYVVGTIAINLGILPVP